MNPAGRENWGPSQAPGASSGQPPSDQSQASASRPMGSFGPNHQGQQPPQQPPAQASGPVLPPPSAPFFSPNQGPGHNLPTLPGLNQSAQASPGQVPQRTATSAPDSTQTVPSHQAPPQGPGYSLPGIGQAMQSQQLGQGQTGGIDRERDIRDERHAEELALQAEQRERELRERQQQMDQTPHENHAGPIHIHQPVAVGPQVRAIHGPNGILGNSAQMPPNPLSANLGAPNGPANLFGAGPTQQQTDGTARMQHAAQAPQSLLVPFGGAHAHAMQQTMAMNQGQQPILNDALSYLDQVKVQFHDHPDVYNKFLDIMKDFKSGAIDTPGVIERVSTLFAGHPNLIQGFNTFLPPGYKIECGTGGDPNAIRVTTPMGTTVSSMPVPRPLSNPRSVPVNGEATGAAERQFFEAASRGPSGTWPQQPTAGAPEGMFSPSRAVAQPGFGAQQVPNGQPPISPEMQAREQHQAAMTAAALAHQQEQRGVSQLSNAVTAATGGMPGTPAQLAGQGLNGAGHMGQQAGANAGLDKRGPVEFNHAISYVNKIKNRFATQPDIYKQFLEILQTYQRESKPIQDVYAQVTQLFNSAPDLLEDFKQFLPESAAQHRAAQVARQAAADDGFMFSNLRGEPSGPPAMHHTPRNDQAQGRLPPVGNFAPTPQANRGDNKRKRGDRQGTVVSSSAMPSSMVNEAPTSATRTSYMPGSGLNKRNKQQHGAKQAVLADGPAVSPTLIPALPEPLPPNGSTAASADELAFFDRAKKFIGNKNTMNEFLKLCNLFSQDLVERKLLVHRAQQFIGGNPELMAWFRKFLAWEASDDNVENQTKPPSGRVALSNCRALGPSYRMLPKAEKMRPCSGRDELCHSVLNDEWASHPTWASEDSGFVAHRKNQYEEGLHRIEEERHDYDHSIEACVRTIQQLEPIAQQLLNMTPEERLQFQLPKNLGGQSETIYKRVIYKIYSRDRGNQVIRSLFENPFNVIPVLLSRMKQKLEEWKAAQREWEKVWREQTQRIFWKSLDHQSASAKASEKRQYQSKTLTSEIQAKYEEQKRQREVQNIATPPYQFEYSFADESVLYDVTRLVLAHAETDPTHVHRIYNFIKEFVPLFFGLDQSRFEQGVGSPRSEFTDDDMTGLDDDSRSAPKTNGKKSTLLSQVLDPGRNGRSSRKEADDSGAASSRGSTPDAGSAADEEMAEEVEVPTVAAVSNSTSDKWLEHPTDKNNITLHDMSADGTYKRTHFNMYCNQNLYCFFRVFVMLYERLNNLKQNEPQVHDAVRRAQEAKPALDLNLIDKRPSDFFRDTSPTANYYSQVLEMFVECSRGEPDQPPIEEALRRYYLQSGWQLYSIDRHLASVTRYVLTILNGEGSKDRTLDLWSLFRKDRMQSETSHDKELHYRKTAEKYTKDDDVYRVTFDANRKVAQIQLFKKDEPTFDQSRLSKERKWNYYISSWTNTEPTEGVAHERVRMPFLKRNHPEEEEEDAAASEPHRSQEDLVIRVSPETYKMVFEPGSFELSVRSDKLRSGGEEGFSAAANHRENRMGAAKEKLVMNNAWMKDRSKDDVDAKKQEFARLMADQSAASGDAAAAAKEDEEMAEA